MEGLNMTVSEEMRAVIELAAINAAEKVGERIEEAFSKAIELHQATCPIGGELREIVAKGKGMVIASRVWIGIIAAIGSTAGAAIVLIVKAVFASR